MVSGGRTPADAAVSVVEHEVAVQSSVFIALVASVAQVALLARTDVAAVAAVLDGARRLAAWRVGRALARVHALTAAAAADTRRLHTTHARSSPPPTLYYKRCSITTPCSAPSRHCSYSLLSAVLRRCCC